MSKRESDVGRLGGGWIAAAVGLSEYRSPLDAYLRITGEVEDVLEGEAIDRGVFLEPALRAWHQKKVGAALVTTPGTLRPKRADAPAWASYTPDGIVHFDNPHGEIQHTLRLAEYKSPGDDAQLRYGTPGTDQVPMDVGVQVHWGLFVTDLPQADVAALIGGELRLFHVQRDTALEYDVLDKARFFMERYVATKTPPPPTFSERDTAWVSKRWPKHDEAKSLQWTSLTNEQRGLIDRYIHVYQAEKDLERQKQELENRVKVDVFRDSAEVLTVEGDESAPFKRISWRTNEHGNPKYKEVVAVLNELLLKGAAWSPGALEVLVESNRSEPARVFRPWFRRGQ